MQDIQPVVRLMKNVGEQILRWRAEADLTHYDYKKGKEVVSELDKKAERLIRAEVRNLFPSHKLWGEELGKDSGDLDNENFLVVDPIDGTKNYLSGNPLFASQIACLEGGRIRWGIVNLPALNELYTAIEGQGALCNNNPIHPSRQDNLGLALQCFGIGHDAENFLRLPRLIKNHLAEPRHYGCAGVHFSFLASGRTDIYIAAEAAFYDAAAGYLLCKEAGLEFATLDGQPFPWGTRGLNVVIANSSLIAEYKKAIQHS